MKIEKYHGLGNSFLITNYLENINYKELSLKLCNNNTSLGGDGLIVVKTNPLQMSIYNKDGSEAIMCGNGLRCFLHYCFLNGVLKERRENIEVKTKSGIYSCDILSYSPFISKVKFKRSLIRKETIALFGKLYDSYFKEIIYKLKDDFNKQGVFCDETNIDIVTKYNKNTIVIETYERGVGLTRSCGTGAVASALVLNYLYGCSNDINVVNEYGTLEVKIEGNQVYMIGPSEKIMATEVEHD